jgi:hypothetical protein
MMQIFYDDLKPETQQAIKDYFEVETDAELFALTNWDTLPMAFAPLDIDLTTIV